MRKADVSGERPSTNMNTKSGTPKRIILSFKESLKPLCSNEIGLKYPERRKKKPIK
jgi:hypothetical protein